MTYVTDDQMLIDFLAGIGFLSPDGDEWNLADRTAITIATHLTVWRWLGDQKRAAKVAALRSQRDFFLSVDMPVAADHCEEAAHSYESPSGRVELS